MPIEFAEGAFGDRQAVELRFDYECLFHAHETLEHAAILRSTQVQSDSRRERRLLEASFLSSPAFSRRIHVIGNPFELHLIIQSGPEPCVRFDFGHM